MPDLILRRAPVSRPPASGRMTILTCLPMAMMPDEEISRDFHALRELGNEFAHTKTMLHFGSNDVQPFLQNLHGWSKEADPKSLFDERVSALTVILTQHLEASNFADALLSQDHFDQT